MTENNPSIQVSGRTSYDETPYPSAAFAQTHPNRLAAMARLFGIDAPSPSTARVLELGCADGSNLLPMAEMAPNGSFLGVDASQVQIAAGQRAIEAVALKNVTLRVQDIMDFPASEGKFDYIIAHGIFSWVPEPVREKILAICREHLTEKGVAYVSYNALPGWNMRRSLRDVMLYHTLPFQDPVRKVEQARAVLGFLAQSVPTEGNAYGLLLKSELNDLQHRQDGFLRHDLLEEENTAFYFHEFIAQAGKHGLQFLGETALSEMLADNFPEKVRAKLFEVGRTTLAQEQYMDFLRNRMFRQTLLCRSEVAISRSVDADRMKGLAFQSLLKPVSAAAGAEQGNVTYLGMNGAKLETKNPFLSSVLKVLAQHGSRALSFGELLRDARALMQGKGGASAESEAVQEEASLATFLVTLLAKGLVVGFAEPVPVAIYAPGKPKVAALTRYQAMNGRSVVNRLHQPVNADGLMRNLVDLCDGSRTGDELLDALVLRAQQGELKVTEGGLPVTDENRLKILLVSGVRNGAALMAAAGLFAP